MKRVLACACGSGNDLNWLRAAGLSLLGSAVSLSMLREARKNVDEAGFHLPTVRADFRTAPYDPELSDKLVVIERE